jgi:hypothetical protein
MHQHTDVGGASAGWHFLANQHAGELLVPAHGIHRGHRNHLHPCAKRCRLHRGNGFGLVVLDADQRFFRAHRPLDQ